MEASKTEPKTTRVQALVYVCPTEGCGNYYASASARPLQEQENRRTSMRNLHTEDPSEWGKLTGTRDECPDCRERDGLTVKRVPMLVQFQVPQPE